MKRSNSNTIKYNSQKALKLLNEKFSKSHNYHYTEYKSIFCPSPKCISFASISITKENDDFFTNLTCEKDHEEKIPINSFINDYQNYNIKECPQCHLKQHVNHIYYCFSCKEKICIKCKEGHAKKMNKKNTNEHLIESIVIKDRKCKHHQYKLNEYYCQNCKKYLCKECLKIGHFNHNINNLYVNIDKIKHILKAFISKQEEINNLELSAFNKLVVKAKNCFEEKCKYDKIISNIKRNILRAYENNKDNYHCKKNLNLISKSFYNKNKYNSAFPEFAKEFGIIVNDNYSKEENKEKKIKEKNIANSINDKNDIFRENNYPNEKQKIKEGNNIPTLGIITNKNNDSFKSLSHSIKLNKLEINYITHYNLIHKTSEKNIGKNNKMFPMEIDNRSDNSDDPDLFEIKSNYSDMNCPPLFFISDSNFNSLKNLNKDIKEKDSQNKCYKIIKTYKKIKSIFCLSHNNIILCFDCNGNGCTTVYKIIPDKKEYIKIKHLKYINIIEEAVNHIEKYQDDILLLCSDKIIVEIKIINHEKFDFIKLFRFGSNFSSLSENNNLQKDSNLKLCLPLSSGNFIVSSIDKINYWKRQKNVINALNQEPYS